MAIVVAGATSHLGGLTIESLLTKGVPAAEIVAAGRRPEALARWADAGLRTVRIDFSDPASLDGLFDAGDAALLVSSSELGHRVAQHGNVVRAATEAGVERLVYTSAPHARTTHLALAPEHKATEELIAAAGLPSTILRNGWYTENYLPGLKKAAVTGEVVASVGDGRVASASRRDFAEATAVVLSESGHLGRVYELTGDIAWNFDDLAAAYSEVLGREVVYRRADPAEHREILLADGLDEGTAGFVVALDGDIRDGLLAETSGELRTLIARPTTPLLEGLRAAQS